jgi:ribosomal protein L7/L12
MKSSSSTSLRVVGQMITSRTIKRRALSPNYYFSTETVASSTSNETPTEVPPYTFRYPKAKDLFERITTTMTKNDVESLADEISSILGRPIRANEFYYNGFGGKLGSGGFGGMISGIDGGDANNAPAVEEVKSTFDVKLSSFDASSKIKIIKEIRAAANLGLKEAKDLVESAPKIIQKGMKLEEAEALKKKLEELGAQIELV